MARRPPRKPFDPDINRAVALKYARGDADAPRVTAKGEGLLADKIIEVARAHGVEVRSDRDLVRLLDTVDIDSPIPLEAFQAVAEILSYIYRRQDKLKPPKSGEKRER